MSPQLKNYLLAAAVIFLVLASGVNGYYLGTQHPKTIIVKGVDNIENGAINNNDFGIFWQTWDIIKKNYLRTDQIKNQDLVYGSAAGLVAALNDPYSIFLPPSDSKKFADDIRGAFGGIGAEIGTKGDFVVIIAPLKDSPAEKSGLKAGDKILEVNASSTINMGIEDVIKKIRGPRGTKVILTILSNGSDKPKKVEVVRDTIKVPTIKWEMKDDKIAHLQLFSFNEAAPQLFVNALNEILAADARGLVFDLRNNPGGFLEVAVSMAGVFIENGKEVVAEEFASGKRNPFFSKGSAVLKDFPMIILINKGSASASEILAGAIRDHNGIKLLGEKSFGKGTVQELKELPDGSSVKITVAHWVLPKGGVIESNGLEPEVEIKITDEDIEAKRDPQLEKAIEILKSQLVKE